MNDNFKTIYSEGYRVTLIGGICNVGLITLKLVAGIVSHSEALIADAVHSLSDLIADLITLAGFKIGRKEADANHHFGHGRVETFFSSLTGMLLVLGGGYIAFHAICQYQILVSSSTWDSGCGSCFLLHTNQRGPLPMDNSSMDTNEKNGTEKEGR